ncbi:MAG: fumarylacetoacetate hydrolase family protein [Kordiimonadaceae bacterium]|nr:fumarylacetoacetate hydrolase family protein [Kordiimonadaceae bacterium]
MTNINALAEQVDAAAHKAFAIPQLTENATLTLEDAYEIQRKSVEQRLARGEKLLGVKMGFTSRAKAIQMGVDDLIYGKLTTGMIVEDGGTITLDDYVHPRVEPELALLLSAPLEGEVGMMEAYAAVSAVAPAIEIIDSRYQDFKFSLIDVVADNSSSSGFVLGNWQEKPADPSNLGMILSFNGKPVQIGSTAAVMGNPIRSLVTAARMLAANGERLEAGQVVLTGGATAAEALSAGVSVTAELEGLGRVGFKVGSK